MGDAVEVDPAAQRRPRPIFALADEVTRRTQSPEERYASIYLVIHDLAQFRDLRQGEDDFSFSFSSSNGKKPAVDRRFRDILKEGPAVGVHVLLWCESYNSLTRAIDRLTLREIEYRVATQMSAADSTSLIDSPAAALLGRAPRHPLPRRPRHANQVPPLRPAHARVARLVRRTTPPRSRRHGDHYAHLIPARSRLTHDG